MTCVYRFTAIISSYFLLGLGGDKKDQDEKTTGKGNAVFPLNGDNPFQAEAERIKTQSVRIRNTRSGRSQSRQASRGSRRMEEEQDDGFTLSDVLESDLWKLSLDFLIIVNTLTFLIWNDVPSTRIRAVFEYIQVVTSSLFLLEIVLRVYSAGAVWQFAKDPMNLFDALVTVVSSVGLFLQLASASSASVQTWKSISVIRLLRTLMQLRHTRQILILAAKSIPVVFNLVIVIVVRLQTW